MLMRLPVQLAITHIYHLFDELKKYTPIIKQFFTFACGALFTRGLTLLFAPITMQILSPADYGLLALANSFISILTAFLGLGLRQMLPLEYFHADQEERFKLIGNIICMYLFVSVPTLLLLALNTNLINYYLFVGQAPWLLLTISLFISFIYFFVELFYQLLQYQQQAWALTKLQGGITILVIIFNLFFLCIMNLGASSIFLGQAIGMCIVCLLGIRIFIKKHGAAHINIKRSLRLMGSYIIMGLPFIPSMLFGVLLASGDRWVLAHLSTLHNVGIYSVANTLGQLTNMIVFYAITGSYMPYMLNRFTENNNNIIRLEQENKRAMWASMVASFILLTIGFATGRPLLYWLMPVAFHEAISYMYMLLLGSVFLLGTCFLNCLIQFKKKSLFLGLVLCLPASMNVLLNLLLIPYLGLYGCVVATLISYISYFVITFVYNVSLIRKIQSSKRMTYS